MRYFYNVNAQANKENEINFFILPPVIKEKKQAVNTENPQPSKEEETLHLTADMVKQAPAYAVLAKQKFPLVMVRYTIYKTNADLSQIESAKLNEHLKSLTESKQATTVTSGELQITNKGGKKKKKKKISPLVFKFIIGGIIVTSLALGAGIGAFIGGFNKAVDTHGGLISDTDGLVMPDDVQFSPNAKLLTVSIDRSYSPIPREDIQVKGEIIDGVATITLPAFDRTDFFSHVPGYSWGFTSDPNGVRIEFYGGGTYNFTENVKLYRVLVKYSCK